MDRPFFIRPQPVINEPWLVVRDGNDDYAYVLHCGHWYPHNIRIASATTRAAALRLATAFNRYYRRKMPAAVEMLRLMAHWDRDRNIRAKCEAAQRYDRWFDTVFDVSHVYAPADRSAYAARTP